MRWQSVALDLRIACDSICHTKMVSDAMKMKEARRNEVSGGHTKINPTNPVWAGVWEEFQGSKMHV